MNTRPVVNEARRLDSVTFELFVPQAAEWISLNGRDHWAKRAKRTKSWRNAGHIMARAAKLPKGLVRVHMEAAIHKTTTRSYDAHNLVPTLKAIIDGIVTDYGLLPDDSNAYFTGPDMRAGEVRQKPGVTLRITVVE